MMMKKKKRENIRKRKERKYIEKKKKKRSRKTGAPLLDLCYDHQGLWPIHTICVWPSLVAHLIWTICDHATAAAAPKLHPRMRLENTLRYVKVNKNSSNSFTHTCLHEIIQIHASLVYVICSGLGVLVYGISIGFLKLSMVLRLKKLL